MIKEANSKYGKLQLVIGVPDDYEEHRCQYAREYVAEHIGTALSEAWIIQQTIPVDPVHTKDNHTYYRFKGHFLMEEIDETLSIE